MTIQPNDNREDFLLSMAHAYGATVHVADLPGTTRGQYIADESRIYLRRGMTRAQRVSTLAHEVIHARRGDNGPQNSCVEDHVDEEAAGLIITEPAYAYAENLVGPNPRLLASELDVTPGLVEAWQRRRNREYHLPRTSDGARLPL